MIRRPVGHNLNPDERDRLFALIKSGASTCEIIEQMGVTDGTVARWRRHVNVPDPHYRNTVPQATIDLVAELTHAGRSLDDIARRLNCTTRSVSRYRALGKVTVDVRLTDAEVGRARALLDSGMSYRQIGDLLGRSATAIARRFPGRGWSQSDACVYRHAKEKLATAGIRV